MITRFKDYLAKTNLAKNTVASYVWTVNYFLSHYGEVNKKNLLTYKGYLVENFDLLVKTGAETPQKQENATL